MDDVVRLHAVRHMVADVADELPRAPRDHRALQHPADAVVEADGGVVVAGPGEAVAVHVEDMARAAVGLDVPQDVVVCAHFERRVVGEDAAVDTAEGGCL